jgi:hypothetical protein
MLRKRVQGVLLMCLLWSGSAYAATRDEVINGATCIPYPPYGNSAAAASAYQHWLYGFGQGAYCHLTMSNEWTVNDLSYVLFTGSTGAGLLRARLCVHSGDFAVACGSERTISAGGFPVNWVAPPSVMPPDASGAFVFILFPSSTVSTIRQLIPVWDK